MRRFSTVLLIVPSLLLAVYPCAALGEIHEGITVVSPDGLLGWDFSSQSHVPIEEADLAIIYVFDPPLGYLVSSATGTLFVGIATPYEDVAEAPPLGSNYTHELTAVENIITYVAYTPEGHFAKFKILSLAGGRTIEYAYQDDGSRVLDDEVPVEESSWGRIKLLYRAR